MKPYTSVLSLVLVAYLSLAGVVSAQEVSVPKIEPSKVQPTLSAATFGLDQFHQPEDTPFNAPGSPRLTQNYRRPLGSEVLISVGIFQMVSRANACAIGQGPCYRTFDRPRFAIGGWEPQFSIRRERWGSNQQISVKFGIRKFF